MMRVLRKTIPLIVIIAAIAFIMLQIIFHNNPTWNSFVGIGESTQKTTLTTYAIPTSTSPNSQYPTQITETIQIQNAKTLWDWLQLLIVPIVLAIGAFYLNQAERRSEQAIAEDRIRENILQTYLDNITELMLKSNLQSTNSLTNELKAVQNVARVRTLTALRGLDAKRKGIVIRFLSESGLISKNSPLIDLRDADLYGANLVDADLTAVNLDKVNLRDADLRGAKLPGSRLREADLSGARLDATILGGNYRILGKTKIWASPSPAQKRFLSVQTKRIGLMFGGISQVGYSEFGMIGDFILFGKILVNAKSYTELSNVDLSNSNLRNAKMSGVNMQGAKLSKANLRACDLSGALLMGCKIDDANLISTKFIGANMEGADLKLSTFQVDPFWEDVKPPATDFTGANLRGADLSDLSLKHIIFYGADLKDANLKKSDLTNADLNDTKVSDTQLSKTRSLTGTIMPDGKKHH